MNCRAATPSAGGAPRFEGFTTEHTEGTEGSERFIGAADIFKAGAARNHPIEAGSRDERASRFFRTLVGEAGKPLCALRVLCGEFLSLHPHERWPCSRAANATQYPQIVESIDSGAAKWIDDI